MQGSGAQASLSHQGQAVSHGSDRAAAMHAWSLFPFPGAVLGGLPLLPTTCEDNIPAAYGWETQAVPSTGILGWMKEQVWAPWWSGWEAPPVESREGTRGRKHVFRLCPPCPCSRAPLGFCTSSMCAAPTPAQLSRESVNCEPSSLPST